MTIGNIGFLKPDNMTGASLVPTSPTLPMGGSSARSGVEPSGAVGFGEFLRNAIGEVNAMQQESAQITDDFIAGRTDSIHEVMITAERASIALQLTLEIRNKVLEAYQEINRMQI